jgi:glutamate dehydrogenase (NAD(P)+)
MYYVEIAILMLNPNREKPTIKVPHGKALDKDINAEGCCTGKFIAQGGINGRNESTGLGVYYAIRELTSYQNFCDKVKLPKGIKNRTFLVQGFGAVGYWAAKFLE